jgi:hypothetical protein
VRGWKDIFESTYDDFSAERVKANYNMVFGHLTQIRPDLELQPAIQRLEDIWNPAAPLTGPKRFRAKLYDRSKLLSGRWRHLSIRSSITLGHGSPPNQYVIKDNGGRSQPTATVADYHTSRASAGSARTRRGNKEVGLVPAVEADAKRPIFQDAVHACGYQLIGPPPILSCNCFMSIPSR